MIILRTPPGDGPEIWCRGDVGPHGFLSIAAHAHADALSIELRHDGVELLIDPGTYCYHGEPEWRQWFRSTAAHNTLEVCGVDQSVSGGPFLWTEQARTRPLTMDEGGELPPQSWSAEHDGYRRLRLPTGHRRSVRLNTAVRELTVDDTLDVAEPLDVRLFWHFGPQISVRLESDVAMLTWTAGGIDWSAQVHLPSALEWSAYRGSENPISGWYSPGFAQRIPTTSLVGVGTASRVTGLRTTFQLP
jgi:uncharacterized heparinase superfamily protein